MNLTAVRKTITPLGWTVLLLALPAAVLALILQWVEAWAVAVLGAVLILLALPFLLGSRSYRVSLGVAHTRITAGDTLTAELTVINRGVRPALPARAELPLGFETLEVAVPFLATNASFRTELTVNTSRRGVVTVGPLTLARQDPLGLFRREVTWEEHHRVYVHPVTVPLPPHTTGLVRDLEGSTLGKITDADIAFHALREYTAGDDPRHVHWKATAKTGQLMVRQYEESQSARIAIVLDPNLAAYRSDQEFELAVSVAGSFALQAVRDGRDRFLLAEHEIASRTADGLLDGLTVLRPAERNTPLETRARALARSRASLSMVVIVTGAETPAAVLRQCAALLPPSAVTLGVRCELYADPSVRRSGRTALATVGALADLPHLLIRGEV